MNQLNSKGLKKTTFGPRKLKACQYCYDKKIKCTRADPNGECYRCIKMKQKCIKRTPITHFLLDEHHIENPIELNKYKFSLNSIESPKENTSTIINVTQIFYKICDIIVSTKSEVSPVTIKIKDLLRTNYNARLIDHSVFKNIKHSDVLRFSILPSKQVATELLTSFVEIVSANYQVMNKENMVQVLDLIYYKNCDLLLDSDELRSSVVKLLLVLALGRLHDVKVEHIRENYPGIQLFKHALELMVHNFEDITLSYIENLILISVYSLSLNAINSTNFYISMAIKGVFIKGLHKESTYNDPNISEIEKERMKRLWCTVFNCDSYYSSLIGCPSIICGNMLSQTLLPTDDHSHYFTKSYFLTERVKLTCIKKDIIRLLNTKFVNNEDPIFVERNVLSDLKSRLDSVLSETNNPANQSNVKKRALLAIALRLNECISLSTLLFFLKLWTMNMRKSLDLDYVEFSSAVTEGYVNLSKVCINAAISTLNIVNGLVESDDLSTFGYIDTNLLFFASIIIFLARNLSNITSINVDKHYEQCITIFQKITKMGGAMANEYLNMLLALQEFTVHLEINSFNYFPNFDPLSTEFVDSPIFIEFFESLKEFDFNQLNMFD